MHAAGHTPRTYTFSSLKQHAVSQCASCLVDWLSLTRSVHFRLVRLFASVVGGWRSIRKRRGGGCFGLSSRLMPRPDARVTCSGWRFVDDRSAGCSWSPALFDVGRIRFMMCSLLDGVSVLSRSVSRSVLALSAPSRPIHERYRSHALLPLPIKINQNKTKKTNKQKQTNKNKQSKTHCHKQAYVDSLFSLGKPFICRPPSLPSSSASF